MDRKSLFYTLRRAKMSLGVNQPCTQRPSLIGLGNRCTVYISKQTVWILSRGVPNDIHFTHLRTHHMTPVNCTGHKSSKFVSELSELNPECNYFMTLAGINHSASCNISKSSIFEQCVSGRGPFFYLPQNKLKAIFFNRPQGTVLFLVPQWDIPPPL